MKIIHLKYKQLKNLGNFENESLEVEVWLGPEDSPADAFRRAKAFVEARLLGIPTEADVAQAKGR